MDLKAIRKQIDQALAAHKNAEAEYHQHFTSATKLKTRLDDANGKVEEAKKEIDAVSVDALDKDSQLISKLSRRKAEAEDNASVFQRAINSTNASFVESKVKLAVAEGNLIQAQRTSLQRSYRLA